MSVRRRRRAKITPPVPLDPAPTSALSTFTDLGIDVVLDTTYQVGQHVDGSYFVIANGSQQVTFASGCQINAGEASNTYFGGQLASGLGTKCVVVDPDTNMKQPFDNRTQSSQGPGMTGIYDASLAVPLPATITVSNKPKTVWFYRGRDAVEIGGTYTGCYALVQVTVYPNNLTPRINPIKPSGYAGAKTMYTTANINYNRFTPISLPSGAVEPDWTQNKYLKRGLYKTGYYGSGTYMDVFTPSGLHGSPYPAAQAEFTYTTILGALTDIADRQDLINRIVTSGLELYDQMQNGKTYKATRSQFSAGGGFGYGGYRGVVFFAGFWLNNAAMMAKPADDSYDYVNANVDTSTWAEDGISYWGDATSGAPYGNWPVQRPNYGVIGQPYPTPPFGDNHDSRDPNGEREPTTLAYFTGTVASATASTITLDSAADGKTIVPGGGVAGNAAVAIISGTGAGQVRHLISWNSGTRTGNIGSYLGAAFNWTVTPDNTSVYEYYDAGGYQTLASQGTCPVAIALTIAGLETEWGNDSFIAYARRWFAEGGHIGPYGRSLQREYGAGETDLQRVYNTNSDFMEKYWLQVAKPAYSFNINQGAPVLWGESVTAYDASSITVQFVTDKDNGTIFLIAQPTAVATPSAAQVIAGLNGAGAAASATLSVAAPTYGGALETYQLTGLSASTSYEVFAVHRDSDGQSSNVLLAATQTTATPDFSKVEFDGTNDYLARGAGLTGAADTDVLSIVFRCRIDGTTGFRYVFCDNTGDTAIIFRPTTNNLTVQIKDASVGNYIEQSESVSGITLGQFHTFFIKLKKSATKSRQIYRDGTALSPTVVVDNTGNMDLTGTNFYVGSASGGSSKFAGQMQFFWLDDVDIDFSSSTNRDKFLYSAIGADGSGPTGSAPLIYFTGAASVWNAGDNLGTGGDFTMNGAVTDV